MGKTQEYLRQQLDSYTFLPEETKNIIILSCVQSNLPAINDFWRLVEISPKNTSQNLSNITNSTNTIVQSWNHYIKKLDALGEPSADIQYVWYYKTPLQPDDITPDT